MVGSGSQSTACRVDFAKDYATDDSERAKLWDIQDLKIEVNGNKIVDVMFHGQNNEAPVPASIKVDVSDVARNVASMDRRFDLHFTNHGHTCWMETGGLKNDDLSEDSPTSEAPLCSLDVEVPPPPGEFSDGKTTVGARVAPIAADDEILEESFTVELAGLVRDMGLNGQRGIHTGRAPDGERWLITLAGGRRVNVKMPNIKPAGGLDAEVVQRKATSAIPLKGLEDPPNRAMIEAHDLTHLPAAPWCESLFKPEGKVTGTRKSKTIAGYRACKWISRSFLVCCLVSRGTCQSICADDGRHGYWVLMVSGKSPDNFMVRSTASFVDKLRAKKTRLRYDNEPEVSQLAEKSATFQHPRTTILEPINSAQHQSVGGVERAQQSIQAATRALRTDIRGRTVCLDTHSCSGCSNMQRGAQSIQASKSQLGNQRGHVPQESLRRAYSECR